MKFITWVIKITLFAVFGRLGEGKTLALTYLTFDHWFNRREKIYSNYHLFKIPYYYIEGINQLNTPRGSRSSPTFIALDEIWRIINARTPMKKRNQIVYDILGRSRKRFLTFVFTSQLKRTIDRNVVDVLDFVSKPSMTADEGILRLDIFMGSKASPATHIKSPRFVTEPFMNLYHSITGDQDIFFYDDSGFHIEKISDFEKKEYMNVKIPTVNLDTLKMEIKPLKKFLKHKVNKDGYLIKTQYGREIKITGDHSIFVLDSKFKALNCSIKMGKVGIKKKEGRELNIDDYVVLPKNIPVIEKGVGKISVGDIVCDEMEKIKNKNDFSGINNEIVVDGDLLWILGFYVAEGSKDCDNYYLRFYSEKRFIEKARKIIREKFGIEAKTYRETSKKKGIIDLFISNRAMIILFKELTENLSWIVQLPKSKLKYFLKGWWDGDGYHNGNCEIFKIITANEKLINHLIVMLNRFGLVAGITKVNGGKFKSYHISVSGISKEKANDVLSWDKDINQELRSRQYNDLVFAKIKKIVPFKINETVYDLSVEGNHTFLAGNEIICSNSEEEIDMVSECDEEPKLIFQPHLEVTEDGFLHPEHGYCCTCDKCGTKFFKKWEKADAYAGDWWNKHWKEVIPESLMMG